MYVDLFEIEFEIECYRAVMIEIECYPAYMKNQTPSGYMFWCWRYLKPNSMWMLVKYVVKETEINADISLEISAWEIEKMW